MTKCICPPNQRGRTSAERLKVTALGIEGALGIRGTSLHLRLNLAQVVLLGQRTLA
jgi:hypothetical protein